MRLAFISTMSGAPWGGSEELWSQTALRLHQEGHEVLASVVWHPQLSPKALALEKQGVRLFPWKLPVHQSLPAQLWTKARRKLRRPEAAVAWLRTHQPDFVVISQGCIWDGIEWMNCCAAAGMRFVTVVQLNTEIWWPDDRQRVEMAQAYQAAKRVFCVSRHNLDLLENQLGVSLPRAEVVWNPFNVPTDPPPPWPSEESCLRMACVARLEPTAKGQDVLLKVLSQDQWRKRPVEINFYGSGPCEQSLRSLANRLELKNVHFRGQVADVAAIWKENHILVLPSRTEGLPLALVEAMWCGRPAIVTNSGGNAEVCMAGETGFVAAAPAVSLLAETMEQAWERRHEWQSMGQAARAHAAKIIPRDPINKFCQQLLKCASKS